MLTPSPASIAFLIAVVSSVLPSPTAPKSFTDISSFNLLSIVRALPPVADWVKESLLARIAASDLTSASTIVSLIILAELTELSANLAVVIALLSIVQVLPDTLISPLSPLVTAVLVTSGNSSTLYLIWSKLLFKSTAVIALPALNVLTAVVTSVTLFTSTLSPLAKADVKVIVAEPLVPDIV